MLHQRTTTMAHSNDNKSLKRSGEQSKLGTNDERQKKVVIVETDTPLEVAFEEVADRLKGVVQQGRLIIHQFAPPIEMDTPATIFTEDIGLDIGLIKHEIADILKLLKEGKKMDDEILLQLNQLVRDYDLLENGRVSLPTKRSILTAEEELRVAQYSFQSGGEKQVAATAPVATAPVAVRRSTRFVLDTSSTSALATQTLSNGQVDDYLRRRVQKTTRNRSSQRNKPIAALSEYDSDRHKSGMGLLIHKVQCFTEFTEQLRLANPEDILQLLYHDSLLLEFAKEFYDGIPFPIDIGDKLGVCNLDDDNELITFGDLPRDKQIEMARNIVTVLISIELEFISGTDSTGKLFNGVSGSLENKRELGQSISTQ